MIFRRQLKKLDSLERSYLLGVVVPGGVWVLMLALMRRIDEGLWAHLDMLKSGFFLSLGLALGGLALLQLTRERKAQKGALIALQVLWAIVVTVEMSSHQFYVATGSTLDFYLMIFTLTHLVDNARVIGSEVPVELYFTLVGFVALLAVAPWWLHLRNPGVRITAVPAQGATPQRAWLLGLGGVVCLLATTLPAFSTLDVQRARAPTVKIALSATESLGERFRAAEVNVAPTTLDARIERAGDDAGADASTPRNLVFIVLESTRASATTPYNPDLKTTPFLDELAERSTLAANAFVVVPHSSKALVAILCGIAPNLHMPITEALPDRIPGRCLPTLLDAQGYKSVFFQSATQHFEGRAQLIKNMGFGDFQSGDQMDPTGFEVANYFGYEDEIMLEPSRKWLREHKNQPFFATYFTLTSHHPYLAPSRYGRHDFVEDDVLNRYLNTIHYVDRFVENLFAQYKAMGLYEDTIFVLVGDHGEAFGEHGRYQHDNVVYQEAAHIPLLIYDPQRPEPRRVAQNVNHLDLLPTAVRRLGFEVQEGEYPGTALADVDRQRPMMMNCWYERRCMAQVLGEEKYIHHFGTQPEELFDLREDPDERHNLAATRDDLDARREALLKWRREAISLHEGYAKAQKSAP